MGCNIVASRDCGNVELCDEELVCAPDDSDSLVETLARGIRAQVGRCSLVRAPMTT
jgi:hypothetical protein